MDAHIIFCFLFSIAFDTAPLAISTGPLVVAIRQFLCQLPLHASASAPVPASASAWVSLGSDGGQGEAAGD